MSATPQYDDIEAQHNVDLLPADDDTDEFEAGDCGGRVTIVTGCDF